METEGKTERGYSTKYAPKAIYRVTVVPGTYGGERYVYTLHEGQYSGVYSIQLVRGVTFFETLDEAKADANKRREKKIRALKKQLKALEDRPEIELRDEG